MALAPRPSTQGTRTSVQSKEGKARQRANNKAAQSADPGAIKTAKTTNSGSSGRAVFTARYPQLDWDEVADVAELVCDLAGQFTQSQLGASGYVHQSIAIPLSYVHASVDAHVASRDQMVFLRVYTLSHAKFQEKMAEEAAEAAAAMVAQAAEQGLQGSLDDELA